MTEIIFASRVGQVFTVDVPDSTTNPTSTTTAVARGADAPHVDNAAMGPVTAAPQASAAAAAPATTTQQAAAVVPQPASDHSSTPVPAVVTTDSHTDSSSSDGVARTASFELPFTHETASGSDATASITQDDGSIVVSDSDIGPASDWTIIV